MALINESLPPHDPFWLRAEQEWSAAFHFRRVRAAMRAMFPEPPPAARNWQALLRIFMALAPDGEAQLMRAWPDDEGPTSLAKAMAVFGSDAVPPHLRSHDINFVGARRAAKRVRTAAGTVPHPIRSAVPMDDVLALPPSMLLRRVEDAAEEAACIARGAQRRAVEASREATGAVRRVAGVQEEVADVRSQIGVLRTVAASVEPVVAAAAHGLETLRLEVAAIQRMMVNAEPAAFAALSTMLADAEQRLRASEDRSARAAATAAATEQALTRHQSEVAALQKQVIALRDMLAVADPVVVEPLAQALRDAERRLRSQEDRAALTERALREHGAEIESLRRAAAAMTEPPAAMALRRQVTALEGRVGQDADEVRREMHTIRDELTGLRQAMKSAEPAAAAPIAAAIDDAERRLRRQEAQIAATNQRMTATERDLATLSHTMATTSPAAAEALRRELKSLETRLTDETSGLRDAIESVMRQRKSPSPPPPRDRRTTFDAEADTPRHAAHGSPDCPPNDAPDASPLNADMTRVEFFLRGEECIHYWMSCGVGIDAAITHAFRTSFNDVIVANLNGADVGHAKDALEASVGACAALAAGRITPDLISSIAKHVTYIIVKAAFDGQRAVKVANLMRQAEIPAAFRHILQASA
ncbi:MAG: hypothetical protein EPO40_21505, partial [Myxococcaceae bacterium]